jgi:hypothetical protein
LRPWYDVEPGRHLVVLHLAGRDETEAEVDARAVLKGEVNLQLRVPTAKPARARRDRAGFDICRRLLALGLRAVLLESVMI